ncbi:MAG: family 78 glycoside hydrolase catalytic domain [Bacteroidales bacterium]|nr:family 78 glycoside hydrolase catalytic domain [Bacteroidales bacterium]
MTKTSIYLALITLSLITPAIYAAVPAPDAPTQLRTEHLAAPLGVNTTAPRFSWKNSGDRIKSQTAYEIAVGTDSTALADHSVADLWSSGKTLSPENSLVTYNGIALLPRMQGWWKVRVWNEDGGCSPWSAVSRFGIGIVENSEVPMQGEFIGMPEGYGDMRSPLLRKKLRYPDGDGRVMAHVNSLGYHELYVNGRKAGANVLSPGVSQLDKRSLIVTYDITPLLEEGDNDIIVWLGQGWYKPTTFRAEYGGPLARVEIDRVNGAKIETLLASDGSWKATHSGRRDTGSWWPLQFGGEEVAAAESPAALDSGSLDKLEWVTVATPGITPLAATPDMAGYNRIVRRSQPRSLKVLPDGNYLADMGRVTTGWLHMAMPRLHPGDTVRIEYSDNLTSEGEFDPQGEEDIFISGGNSGEIFCNKFNHHAFRYVRIKGLPEKPRPESIEALQIRGEYADASSFECSDPDLNAIHDMVKYTMQCLTFSGYMVDCPHLERTGYGGDGNSSTMTLQTMYDVAPTYANWLQAWGDVIEPDGSLPHVAPAGGGGGGPYWCAFVVLAPWRTWLNYGDRRIIENTYPLMKKWMEYVSANTKDGLLRRWPDTHNRMWYLADWLAPAGVDAGNEESVDLASNCVISDCLDKMERIALELGLNDEARQWRERRMRLNADIHYRFYNAGTGEYATGSQLDMTYPMLTGATPDYLRGKVRDRMLELSAERNDGHIGVGLMGVPILTQWTIDEHQPDFMASMLRKPDYPGYLHMIDNGATATWEYWSGERSRVHNCYNGIGLWFYEGLGGIVPDPESPGYRHFFIDPQLADGMDWVSVTKETPYGTAAVRWERTDDGVVDYTFDIPAGSSATFIVPQGTPSSSTAMKLSSGKHKIRLSRGGIAVESPDGIR